MPNNQLLQDIGSLLGTNIDLNEDLKEISTTIRDMFQKKYINKITALIENDRLQASQNPTKEVSLLQAVKPFINPNVHSQIDTLIDTMNTMRTFQSLNDKVKNIQYQRNEKEIKEENEKGGAELLVQEDGVYEIDEVCMNSSNQSLTTNNGGLIIFIILILFLFKIK